MTNHTENECQTNIDDTESVKIISNQEYRRLIQNIPEIEKLRNVIKRLENDTKLKDAKLKKYEVAEDNTKLVDLSKLSTVSLFTH